MIIRGHERLAAAVIVIAVVAALSWFFGGAAIRRVLGIGEPAGVAALVEAIGTRRVTAGRLTGGFLFGPAPAVNRSAASATTASSPSSVSGPSAASSSSGTTRSAASSPSSSSSSSDYKLRAAAERIVEYASRDSSAPAIHALGVARLLLGEDDAAARALERAVTIDPGNAAYRTDLAVAYHARALRSGSTFDQARALDALDEALARNGELSEAWYNRALVLDSLGLHGLARTAREEFLKRDGASAWAQEVRGALTSAPENQSAGCRDIARRIDSGGLAPSQLDTLVNACPQAVREYLEWEVIPALGAPVAPVPPTSSTAEARAGLERAAAIAAALARLHGDKLTADAVRLIQRAASAPSSPLARDLTEGYRELTLGRRMYESDRRNESDTHLAKASAALRRAGSPYWLWAEQYLARVASHNRRSAEALERLDRVREAALPASYYSLLAREAWLRGLVLFQSSNPAASLDSYRDATAYYQQLGEVDNFANVLNTAADTQRTIGQLEAGWGNLILALEKLSSIDDPTRRYLATYNASLYCLRHGLTRAALVFQDEAVRHVRMRAGQGGTVEALLNRSKIQATLGNVDRSRRDMAEALALLASLTDAQQRQYMTARYRVVEAELTATSQPNTAVASVTQAIDHFRPVEPGELPRLYQILARAWLQLGDRTQADQALQTGIDLFERRRLILKDELSRAAYFDEGWNLYTDLIDLRLRQNRTAEAFEVAELSKAKSLTDSLQAAASLPTSVTELAKRLPPGSSLVVYAQHGDRMHWWRLEPARVTDGELALSIAELSAAVEGLREAMRDATPTSNVRVDALLGELYRVLITPLSLDASTMALAWVPDGPLQELPVAALRNPRTGRYLIEDVDITFSPSARVFVSPRRAPVNAGAERALIVGNPAFNRGLFPYVLPLKGARREAEEVSGLYPGAMTLLEERATRQRVLELLPQADIVHIAGHAIGNETSPQMSQLLLAPSPGVDAAGALYGYELRAIPFKASLVMLAACRTASGRVHPGEGAMSMARILLASGAGTVIGTLWDVDDIASRDISVRFHRAFKRTRNPAAALREAQRALVNTYPPSSWSAFIVYGGASAPASGEKGTS